MALKAIYKDKETFEAAVDEKYRGAYEEQDDGSYKSIIEVEKEVIKEKDPEIQSAYEKMKKQYEEAQERINQFGDFTPEILKDFAEKMDKEKYDLAVKENRVPEYFNEMIQKQKDQYEENLKNKDEKINQLNSAIVGEKYQKAVNKALKDLNFRNDNARKIAERQMRDDGWVMDEEAGFVRKVNNVVVTTKLENKSGNQQPDEYMEEFKKNYKFLLNLNPKGGGAPGDEGADPDSGDDLPAEIKFSDVAGRKKYRKEIKAGKIKLDWKN